MNITEEDIRSELLEGWEIVDKTALDPTYSAGYVEIGHTGNHTLILFCGGQTKVRFTRICEEANIDYPDFLTGNYDLSSVSKHYSESEWSAIIGMCESIVRLITGEKQPEKSLEEQIISVLEKHKKGYAKFWLTENVLEIRFNSSAVILGASAIDRVRIGNNPEQAYYRFELKEKLENKINGSARGWWGNHAPVILEIIELLESPESTPEKSLEEKVRVLIESERTFIGDKITVEPHQVLIQVGDRTITITKDSVHDTTGDETDCITKLTGSSWNKSVQELFRNIAAELKKHQPSPTYTDLEQRVRELEKLADDLKAANSKWVEHSKKKSDRITELEAKLQDYVSPADHEREMRNNEELLAIITKQRDDCNAQAKQYLSWFHSEYAKNAGVSQ